MKKILLFTFLLFSFNTFAGEIAVVDMEKIIQNSSAFKQLSDSLEKEKNSYQEKIKQKEVELNNKKDELESKSALLSKETLQKQAFEFQNEVLKFQGEIKEKEDELRENLSKGMNTLAKEVADIVNSMLKEDKYKKYSMVINSGVLLHHKDEDDISMEVLKRLNKKNISLISKKKK